MKLLLSGSQLSNERMGNLFVANHKAGRCDVGLEQHHAVFADDLAHFRDLIPRQRQILKQHQI